jgi:hypothetical protein
LLDGSCCASKRSKEEEQQSREGLLKERISLNKKGDMRFKGVVQVMLK